MKSIRRDIQYDISKHLLPNKAVIVYGSRRVGKTMLVRNVIKNYEGRVQVLNGEDVDTKMMLSERSVSRYRQLFGDIDLLVIDEAQHIEEIGWIIKLMVDELPDIRIMATGSSSFDLQNQVGEPLVGRSYSYHLLPYSCNELIDIMTRLQFFKSIESLLLYGCYPEVVSLSTYDEKKRYLVEMSKSYLLKDILAIDGLKNAGKMEMLLRLIAYQQGSEVSYDELATQLSLSRNTVEKYLDLLSKVFILFRLPAFSNNPRKEVSKAGKWYFYDNGVRNAVIDDFRPLVMRQDVGALWESFFITQRMKLQNNRQQRCRYFFWRGYNGQEIDLIEQSEQTVRAFECKWTAKRVKKPSLFDTLYPEATFDVVHRDNFYDYME